MLANGISSITSRKVIDQAKTAIAQLRATLVKWVIDPWGGATTDENYDSLYLGAFALSSSGTISNPSDLGTSAGTGEDATAYYFSGTAQVANTIPYIGNLIRQRFNKIDYVTSLYMSPKVIYWGVHPFFMNILKTNRDIRNSTTGQRSDNTMFEDLVKMDIIPVESPFFHSAYVYTSTTEHTSAVFADPKDNVLIYRVPSLPEGDGWSEWDKARATVGDKTVINYEKHKKLQFAVHPRAIWFNTAATAGSFFKMSFVLRATPYKNT
jgi:hypothetical protein